MIDRTLERDKDPFRPRDDGEDILGPKYPYLSEIGALMYLANNTRPDIAFAVNLLARHSASPTKRHWTGIKMFFNTSMARQISVYSTEEIKILAS
jgi:hypothetical protein